MGTHATMLPLNWGRLPFPSKSEKSGSNCVFDISEGGAVASETPKSERPRSEKIEWYALACGEGVSRREGDDCWR